MPFLIIALALGIASLDIVDNVSAVTDPPAGGGSSFGDTIITVSELFLAALFVGLLIVLIIRFG